MSLAITGIHAADVRFPTSLELDGSDAMNVDPDYSAAYCTVSTNDEALNGFGLAFTIGRGTEIVVAAIEALAPLVSGMTLDDVEADLAGFWRRVVGDSQLRWLGPEKGVIHMAGAAIVNAVWDLLARRAGKPLWRYLADMTPDQIVAAIDFRHIRDALSPAFARELLEQRTAGKATRIAALQAEGHPAYTTSAGWLGYPDEKIQALAEDAMHQGWRALKMKVGRDLQDDVRRCRTLRNVIGDEALLMVDANQVWEVDEAIQWIEALAPFRPYWIEEPVSPDDVLGHARVRQAVRPIRIATGEHCHNRIMFKQFLQADAIDVVQIDACRLGGVNEVLAVLLLAAAHDKAVCPHAGGVGLCEYVQHLSFFDAVAVAADSEGRMIEHAGHLHEHFVDPIRTHRGHYLAPEQPGFSVQMKPESVARYRFPDGEAWNR